MNMFRRKTISEDRGFDTNSPWLRNLGDSKHFSALMGNWYTVSRLGPQERILSEAAFNLLASKGYSKVCVRFDRSMKHEFRISRDDDSFELELHPSYSGLTLSRQLKFVRYAICSTFGTPYIPDLKCFGDIICPTPRNVVMNPVELYRGFNEERIRRCQVIWSSKGEHRDILDSVQRLLDKGLLDIEDISDSRFVWSSEIPGERLGWCAMGIGVVFINKVYDSADIPDACIDYIVYHECLHLRQRFYQKPVTGEHDEQFKIWEKKYPNHYKWYFDACLIANEGIKTS